MKPIKRGIDITMKADTPANMKEASIHLHTDDGGLAFLTIAIGIASEVVKDGRYKLPKEAKKNALIEAFDDWGCMIDEVYEKRNAIKQ